ncbi:Malectin [Orchesella cincta]|uniref:Malectin n=1 Tax=Orchesella cincta TaxID=48709 RepID=A0A1D2M841_ORCCI|nr:Malectin [Orchesella cincta]
MNSYLITVFLFLGSLNPSLSLPEHNHDHDTSDPEILTWDEHSGHYPSDNSSHHRSKRQNRKECWRWCERINDCRYDGCYYDMKTLHCYQSQWHAQYYPVIYSGTAYSPQRMAICVNFGGYSHQAANGYYFHQEPTWLGGFSYSVNNWITNMHDSGDHNVFRSARLDWKILYKILFQYDGHYFLRMMFAEIKPIHFRYQIIKFNYVWIIKNAFDVASYVGGRFKALECYFYPVISNNRRHISIAGQGGWLGPFTAVEVFNIKPFGLAIANGLCLTHFHTCTRWCNNKDACNRHWECWYDDVIRHCVPRSHHEITCRNKGTDRQQCEAAGCNYCCAKLHCQASWDSMAHCNDGCLNHCKEQKKCIMDPEECVYNPETQQCTDKPYDKEKCPTYELLKDSLYTETHLNNCGMDKIRSCVRVPYGINLGGQAYTDDGGAPYIADFYPIYSDPYISDIDKCLPEVEGATFHNRYVFHTFRRLWRKHCFALPIPEDGDYTLQVKFFEFGFLFNRSAGRVFDMLLNDIPVKENINVAKSGSGLRHRYEIVQDFEVRENVRQVLANGLSDKIKATRIHLRFVKKNPGDFDWPQVSAIQVFRTRKCTNELNREQCFLAGCFHDPVKKTCEKKKEIICNPLEGKYCDPFLLVLGRQIELPPTTTMRPAAFGCFVTIYTALSRGI